MSRRVSKRDLLDFNVWEADKVPTGRLLELYRAAQWLQLDWDEYYEGPPEECRARYEELKKKQEELRRDLKFILDHREHVPRPREGKNLRKLMAKYHMNRDEAREFAKEKGIKLNATLAQLGRATA